MVLRVITHDVAYNIDKGIEQQEHPDDTNHVEHQMGQGSTSCLCVGTECSQVGCGCRSDVLSQHQGNAEIDGEHTSGAEQDGDSHHGCRRLYDAGDEGADGEEDKDGEMTASIKRTEEVDNGGVVFKVERLTCSTEEY